MLYIYTHTYDTVTVYYICIYITKGMDYTDIYNYIHKYTTHIPLHTTH